MMNTQWARTEIIRAIAFGFTWIMAFSFFRQQVAWQGGLVAGLAWFATAAVYHTVRTGQPIRPVLLSLFAALVFFVVWMGGVLYTGGNVSEGLVIGLIVAALFGVAYYGFIYIIPGQSKE